MGIFAHGIEVLAPVLAQSRREARDAVAFITESPIRKLASLTLPLLPVSLQMMMKGGERTLFLPDTRWIADSMWMDAPIDPLLPAMRAIAESQPPAPSHALWLNWNAPPSRPDMAFSLEARTYLALYGGMRISVRTDMPGVTPAMIDWWFGWHGDAAAKYKLWHPQAHIHAQWLGTPPTHATGRAAYVGQTSIVDEYIGSDLVRGAIQFVSPATLGFTDPSLDDGRATVVCARLGLGAPIDIGYLAHHVRTVPGGSEMRSRFWMGGRHVAGRNALGSVAAAIAKRVLRLTETDARAVLVHCGQEMPHLAAFLPALYAKFGSGIA